MRQLRDFGPRVLPLLPAPELLPTASVRDAVVQLRGELERRQALLSIKPSTVTLRGTKSLTAWLQEVTVRTGNRFDLSALAAKVANRTEKLDLIDTEFWSAIDHLLIQSNLQLGNSSTSAGVKLEPRTKRESPAVVSTVGAFRFAAGAAQFRPIAGTADRRIIRVPISIFPEPRLRPLFLHYANSEIEARTSTGTLIPSFSPDAKYEIPLGEGGLRVSLQLDFVAPTNTDLTKISLSGKFWMTTAANQEPIRIAGLKSLQGPRSRAIARRRGGVTVTARRVTLPAPEARDRELRVEAAVTYDNGGPAFESHRTWILHNLVYLESPDKQRFQLNGGFDTRLQEDGTVVLEYRFTDVPNPLPDYAFVYVAPTLIVDAPLEFRLNSIPIENP